MNKLTFLLFTTLFLYSCSKDSVETDSTAIALTKINEAYGSDAKQQMDVYLPAGRSTDSTKTIVMIHGGAWVEGDKSDFTSYVSTLQQRFPGYAVVNINYRLATTAVNHFPTQENDMKAAMDYLVTKESEYHISSKFVLLGASAGGHLALLQGYKYANPKVMAVVDFFGPADMKAMYDSASSSMNQYGISILMNGTPSSNSLLYEQSSPVNYVTSQSPPTIILHGTADEIVLPSQSVALYNKLQSKGVVSSLYFYTGQGHDVWPADIMNDAYNKIEQFVKANVH